MSSTLDAASRICTACGMCCNGVLFQVVRLQPGDSVRELSALGMQLRRKKKEPYFTQPCAFLTPACTCTIYAARPTRCRQFQCQLLLSLAAEQTTESEAMLTVEKATAQVAAVIALLPEPDPTLALTEQVQQAAAAQAPQLEALWMAMERLQSLLTTEFLPTQAAVTAGPSHDSGAASTIATP